MQIVTDLSSDQYSVNKGDWDRWVLKDVPIPHDTMILAIHLEGVKYFILSVNTIPAPVLPGAEKGRGGTELSRPWVLTRCCLEIQRSHMGYEGLASHSILSFSVSLHEENSDDEVVPVPLEIEGLDEGFSRFVVVECPAEER